MALESPVVRIEDLVSTNPAAGDVRSEGDDHLRNIKVAVKGSLPYTSASSATLRQAANNTATCTGTNTLTCGLTPALNAYVEGQVFHLEMAGAKNTGAVTLNVDSKGAGALTWPNGDALIDNDLPADCYFAVIVKNSGTPIFHLLTVANPQKFLDITDLLIGEVRMYVGTTAPAKHLILDGSTIGDGSSSATGRANADTSDLFTLLWNGTSNTDLIIQDSSGNPSTRGVSAAVDFSGHKRLPIPDMRDYFPRGKSGSRANLSAQAHGFEDHSHYLKLNIGSNVAGLDMTNAIGTSQGLAAYNPAGTPVATVSVSTANSGNHATETRPQNIAMNFIIRYAV